VKWKLLAGGVGLGALLVVFLVVAVVIAAIGGIWWFVSDDSPLVYYDARPATVDEAGLAQTDYLAVNDTAFNLSYSPVPFVGRDVRVRSWVTVYAKGVTPESVSGRGASAADVDASVGSIAGANTSLVTVFSMSALELGPVAFNPVVYASDPGLLNESGVLVERAENWLPSNVTDVTNVDLRSSRPVRMLGQETQLTTFTGELVLSNDSRVDVRLYLARVVHEGELVIVFGIAPQSEDDRDEFATLVENVRMGEWGTRPGWVPPTAPDPRELLANGSTRPAAIHVSA
jgi:hypothetical protein